MKEQIIAEIKDLLGEGFRQLDASTQREVLLLSLGLDSLEFVEIVQHLENKFDVRIPNADLARIATVGELADRIESLLPA